MRWSILPGVEGDALGGGFSLGIEIHFSVEGGDTDTEHAGGFLAGAAVVFEGLLDEEALLGFDEVVKRRTDGKLLGSSCSLGGGDFDLLADLGWQV